MKQLRIVSFIKISNIRAQIYYVFLLVAFISVFCLVRIIPSISGEGPYYGSFIFSKRYPIIYRHGNPSWCSSNKSASYSRVFFPTIPRSGSTFARELIENSTGIATESVYKEGGKYSLESKSFHKNCGIHGDCSRVRKRNSGEPAMIKTHFPFMGPEFDETQECVSKIIMTVRHPIDNYIAWIAYKGFIKGEIHALKSRRRMKFPMFLELWELHHNYWHAYAHLNDIPLLQFRYEDLCADSKWLTRNILQFLDLEYTAHDEFRSKFKDCYMRNLEKKPKAFSLLTQNDIQRFYEAKTELLDIFSYRKKIKLLKDIK